MTIYTLVGTGSISLMAVLLLPRVHSVHSGRSRLALSEMARRREHVWAHQRLPESALTGEPWQQIARVHRTSLLLAVEEYEKND